jgi:hypothetical protein
MIGKISIGKGFYGAISYCLEGKNGEKKKYAEIIHYNKCFGNKQELIQQIKDVRVLNRRIETPVWHTSISFDPQDQVTKDQLVEISDEFARKFNLENNQYIVVQHFDTNHPHVHIIANRVGFNGKANSTSLNYKKMAELNRLLEKKYGFKEVLSPNKFLKKRKLNTVRIDSRKEKLKQLMPELIHKSNSFEDFKTKVSDLGYQVQAGRGIAFIDDKHVRIKGSEIGYSISKLKRAIENNIQNETLIIQRSLNKSRKL